MYLQYVSYVMNSPPSYFSVAARSQINRMSVDSLAIIFAPVLLRCSVEKLSDVLLLEQQKSVGEVYLQCRTYICTHTHTHTLSHTCIFAGCEVAYHAKRDYFCVKLFILVGHMCPRATKVFLLLLCKPYLGLCVILYVNYF